MNGAAKTPSVRLTSRLCIALGVALSLLFAGLFAAPGAQALQSNAAEVTPSPEAAEMPAEPSSPPAEAPVLPPAVEEPAPLPAVEEPAPLPAVEEPAPLPAVEEPAPAPPVEIPPVEKAPAPPTETKAPAEAPTEVAEPEKKAAGKAPSEAPLIALSPAGEMTLTPPVAVPAPGPAPQVSLPPLPGEPTVSVAPRKLSAHGAAAASCGVTFLAAPITANCAERWLGVPSEPPTLGAPMTVSASSPMPAIEATPAAPRHRRVSVENAPSTPRPGPAPGGSGGVSAAGCGSSAACSSLTSAGPILRIAQIETRPLLVEQPSWRTTFYVLIPERPG
jgi:hypothetical protein